MRIWFWTAVAAILLLPACGPNVLTARGTVMNPLVRDSAEFAYLRVVVLTRKEPRARAAHRIVGVAGVPPALGYLQEPVGIPKQTTDGSGLYFDVGPIYSNYKDEMADFPEKYAFWLVTEDGERIPCRVHRSEPLRDHSVQVSGGSMQPHLVTKDRRSGTTTVYRHWEEVTNDFTLFSRRARVLCQAGRPFLTLETKRLTFVFRGHDRERRYRFDFVSDPEILLELERRR